jgi:hypothetical protein
MRGIVLGLLLVVLGVPGFGLPYIPGCPLHESCVRALKQEQRERQRALRQRDNPNQDLDETSDKEGNVKRPLGIFLSFQVSVGDFNDRQHDYISLKPTVGYMNSFGNFDIFACVFYSFFFDDPGISPVKKDEPLRSLHRGGFEATIGYNFDIADSFTLGISLDNQNQLSLNPDDASLSGDDTYLSSAVMEPLVSLRYELPIGDVSLENSFPFSYVSDKALDYVLGLTVNTDWGFGVRAGFEWWNLWVDTGSEYGMTDPAFQYGQTEVVVNYWRNIFFVSLTLTADREFKRFGVEPYGAVNIGRHLTVFAGVVLDNLGKQADDETLRLNAIQGKRDVTSVIPSLGVKLRF